MKENPAKFCIVYSKKPKTCFHPSLKKEFSLNDVEVTTI